jgi:Lon protease-like protein
MSEEIALFPLSNVVLFPRMRAPLHIFEPRYRQMVDHALASDRRIGMATVHPDHVSRIRGDPPLYPIGCAGYISQAERLPDGRFHMALEGTWRFRIVEEPPRPTERLYRVARIERLSDPNDPSQRDRVRELRSRILELVQRLLALSDRERAPDFTPDLFDGMSDEVFVNSLAQALALATPEKQGLLEAAGIPERCERLEGLLAFRLAEVGLPGSRPTSRLH